MNRVLRQKFWGERCDEFMYELYSISVDDYTLLADYTCGLMVNFDLLYLHASFYIYSILHFNEVARL